MDDQYVLDVELRFSDGDMVSETLVEGRDKVVYTDTRIHLDIQVSPTESVFYEVFKDRLNYRKTTRRKLEPAKRAL